MFFLHLISNETNFWKRINLSLYLRRFCFITIDWKQIIYQKTACEKYLKRWAEVVDIVNLLQRLQLKNCYVDTAKTCWRINLNSFAFFKVDSVVGSATSGHGGVSQCPSTQFVVKSFSVCQKKFCSLSKKKIVFFPRFTRRKIFSICWNQFVPVLQKKIYFSEILDSFALLKFNSSNFIIQCNYRGLLGSIVS